MRSDAPQDRRYRGGNRGRLRRSGAAWTLCTVLSGAVCAQGGPGAVADQDMPVDQDARTDEAATVDRPFDGIEITGSERGPGDVVIEDHTGTRSRVDRTTLQRRDVSLGDVLGRETGVQRRSSGGFGSFASITVRAANAAQTSVLLDGVRLNGAGNPVVDLATLDLLSLDSVDVYRGITPIEFGAGAIGGAVSLTTPRVVPGAAPRLQLGTSFGSFGLARAEAARIARHGRWDSVLSASLTRADNDFGFLDDNGTPLNPDDDRRERRNNADARQAGLLAKLGTGHADGSRSDVLLQLGARQLGVPELRNRPDNVARFDTDSAQLQLRHAHEPAGAWQAAHTAYLHVRQDHFDDRLSQVGLGRQDTRTRSRTLGLDSVWSRALGAGELGVKGELRRETLAGRDRIGRSRDVDARRDRFSLGARYSAYLPGGRWVLAPALTVQHDVDRFAIERAPGDSGRMDASRDDTAVSPAIGARFDHSDSTTWHASLSRYARQPAFAELFIDRGLVRGNPDLRPERGVNLDVGVEHRFARPRPIDNARVAPDENRDDGNTGDSIDQRDRPPARSGSLSANVFISERSEQIVTVFDARGVGRAENVGKARVLGIELAARVDPAPRWSMTTRLTLQDARNRSPNPVLDDNQLPGEAQVAGHASIAYRPAARWRLRLEADTLRDRFYDTANRRAARDYTLVHAGIEHATRHWRTTLALTNLGDRNVEDFNGFPRPGRGALLSLRYTPGNSPT